MYWWSIGRFPVVLVLIWVCKQERFLWMFLCYGRDDMSDYLYHCLLLEKNVLYEKLDEMVLP